MRGFSVNMWTINWVWIWFHAKEIYSCKRMDFLFFFFSLSSAPHPLLSFYRMVSTSVSPISLFVCLFRELWGLYVKKKQDFIFAVMRNIRQIGNTDIFYEMKKHTSCSYEIQLFYWQISISFFLLIFFSAFCIAFEQIFLFF